jgi:hypothetical protein
MGIPGLDAETHASAVGSHCSINGWKPLYPLAQQSSLSAHVTPVK